MVGLTVTWYSEKQLWFLLDAYSIVRNKRRPYVYYIWFFSRLYNLIKGPTFINFGIFSMVYQYFQVWRVFFNITLHILFMPYVYSRPYIYSFWQIFQALRLFPALRLFRTLEYVVSCPNCTKKLQWYRTTLCVRITSTVFTYHKI